MIDLIFFLIVFCLWAAASYFLLKWFYDNAQRYESMSWELREKSSKLFEAESEVKRLEEENKHLRTQWERILAENNDLKDVNWSNSRYSYLISQAADKANELLKILDVHWDFSKKKEEKFSKSIPKETFPKEIIEEKPENIEPETEKNSIFIEKDAHFETKSFNWHTWKRF